MNNWQSFRPSIPLPNACHLTPHQNISYVCRLLPYSVNGLQPRCFCLTLQRYGVFLNLQTFLGVFFEPFSIYLIFRHLQHLFLYGIFFLQFLFTLLNSRAQLYICARIILRVMVATAATNHSHQPQPPTAATNRSIYTDENQITGREATQHGAGSRSIKRKFGSGGLFNYQNIIYKKTDIAKLSFCYVRFYFTLCVR